MIKKTIACLTLALMLVEIPSAGLSQAFAETQVMRRDVIRLNEQGVAMFQEKQYSQALGYFEQAYALAPTDQIVINNLMAAHSAIAVEELQQENFEQAADSFQQVLNVSPQDAASRANIAYANFKMAEKSLQAGQEDEAIARIKKGLRFDPDNETFRQHLSVLLYNKGMKAYGEHLYDEAKELLLESLDYNAGNSYTFEVLGDVAYYTQNLDEARKQWEQAATLEDSDRLRRKIGKLRTEISVDETLEEYPSQYFILKYDKNKESYSGYKLREILRAAYRRVGNDFNYYPKQKTVVLVYEVADLKQVLEAPHWVGAVFDGKIRLPQEGAGVPDENLRAMVWHEYTHAIAYDLSGGQCPVWLNEGLAEYEENKIKPIDVSLLKAKVAQDYVFSLNRDLNRDVKSLTQEEAQMFYLASFSLANFLVTRYRMYKVKEILGKLKEGMTVQQAIENSLFITVDRLEEKWNEYLRRLS